MDITRHIHPTMPVIVCGSEDGSHFVCCVGFTCPKDAVPPPERVIRVWFPVPVGPRPSHGEECVVCTRNTDSSGLAFDFPCKHMICWTCAKSWASKSGQVYNGLSCVMCRDNSLRPGDFFSNCNQVNAIVIKGFECAIACRNPVVYRDLAWADIEVAHDSTNNWWAQIYDSKAKRAPVMDMIEGVETYSILLDEIMLLMHRRCGWCGLAGSPLQCSRCKLVQYCSKECQKKHWSKHKANCVRA
jgi:hypothetical protein